VPSDRGGVDFGAIEGIRAGAQDELEDIQDAKVKFPDHLKDIDAFAQHMGIKKPERPDKLIGDKEASNIEARRSAVRVEPPLGTPRRLDFEEELPIGQEFTETMFDDAAMRERARTGKLMPSEKKRLQSDYQNKLDKYNEQMKGLKAEFDRERRKVIIQQGVDLPKEIQQRIPEYLEQQGVSQMPSPGSEFPLRRDRRGNITSDYGEAKALRSHVRNMLENDDVYTKVWQRLASETGFKLKDDEKFVEIMEELGVGPNDSDFPDITKDPISLREDSAAYGKRVKRRPKSFSFDSPVGQAPVADESAYTKATKESKESSVFCNGKAHC